MEPLKPAVFDADDLAVVSAHLQDAILRVGDLSYLPDRRRFATVLRRFDWEVPGEARRRLSGLQFERVLGVRTRGIDRARVDESLSLLAVTFTAGEPPGGTAELVFAGGGTVQLQLECLEAAMKDLGPVWSAETTPEHDLVADVAEQVSSGRNPT